MRSILIRARVHASVGGIVAISSLAACAPGLANSPSGVAPATAVVAPARTDAQVGRYATVNGLRMYYEIHGATHGAGRPLVLLHGGGETIGTSFGSVLPAFAASREVIAIELQGHGHTPDRAGPLSFAQDADDVAAVLHEIGVPQVDVLGFSNGANSALELERRHPEMVRRLVFAAGFVTKDGIPAPVWTSFRQPPDTANMPPVLRAAYRQAAPEPSHLPVLVTKLMQRLNGFEDLTDGDVRSLQAPALIMIGDQDVITLEHGTRMARLLPRAQLVVFPGAGHGAYFGDAIAAPCPECVSAAVGFVNRFLDAPSAAAK